MPIGITEDHVALHQAVRGWLERHCPPAVPRALLDADRAIRREGLGALPLLQILDEVLFEVPEAELAESARVCAHAMKHAYDREVPLAVGVEAGANWADLEAVDPERR